jgi:SAM-dependent methyltransferase
MAHPLSNHVWNHLVCGYCGGGLKKAESGADCSHCGLSYPYALSGSLDLRLKRPKKYNLDFDLGTPLLPETGFDFTPLKANETPAVDFSNIVVPRHLTKGILSYFPKASSDSSLALDLGSGAGIHKNVCDCAGFEWVGMDYEAPQAPILGDGHSLPFKDETFEFILCVTVLQYIRYPFVMMREAYRVLKPGGKIIGTVAFLEPSHGTSFYHHSHLGAYNSLQYGGFKVERLAPSAEWSVLVALANMGLFYGMPRPLAQAFISPLQLFHELWWRIGGLISRKNVEETRIRHFTGSLTFVASK